MEKKNIWIAFLMIGMLVFVPVAFVAFSIWQKEKAETILKQEMDQATKEAPVTYDLEKNYCVYLYPEYIRLVTKDTDEQVAYNDFASVLQSQLTDRSKTILLLVNKDTDDTIVSKVMNTLSEQQVTNYDLMSE